MNVKSIYAELLKTWNTGYNSSIGRFAGISNLFFTIATFFVVKGFNLTFIQTALIGFGVFLALMLFGYIYLKTGLLKAENQANFVENPQYAEMLHKIREIELSLKRIEKELN